MSKTEAYECIGVPNFISYVIERSSALLRNDPEEWEARIRAKLKKRCDDAYNWETFTSTLALCLGTDYEEGEEFDFILSLLANAAYLRRKPHCQGCGARRKPAFNSLVFVCPYCTEPIYETAA